MITISSLNNEAAVARSIALVGSDVNRQRWINVSDTNPRQTFESQTRLTGRRGSLGIAQRQFNFKMVSAKPFTTQVAGTDRQMFEELILSTTLIVPETMTLHTATDVYNLGAFLRQVLVAGNFDRMLRGEP